MAPSWIGVVAATIVVLGVLGAGGAVAGDDVGFRTFDAVDPTRRNLGDDAGCQPVSPELGRDVPLLVWYPADPEGSEPRVTYPGGSALQDPPVASGAPRPLIVFSHGFGGIALQSPNLMEALAANGFVAISLEHTGNAALGAFTCFEQAALDRSPDISFAIDWMLARNADAEDDFFGLVDPEQIGVAGHSFGGFTALAVASGYRGIPPDARVKAVVGIAPASSAISDPELASIEVPTLLLTGTRDGLRFAHAAAAELISADDLYSVYVVGAAHTHFADICNIAQRLIQSGFPPESWPGSPFAALTGPYNESCAPGVFPIDEALALQNLYVVAHFRLHLMGDASQAEVLTREYAYEQQLSVAFELVDPIEFSVDDLAVLEPDPHTVTWIDGTSGRRRPMSRFNVGFGPDLIDPVALVAEGLDAIHVADVGLPGVLRVSPALGDRTVVASGEVGEGPSLAGIRDLAVLRGDLYAVLLNSVVQIDPGTGDREAVEPLAPTSARGEPTPIFQDLTAVAAEASGRLLLTDAGWPGVLTLWPGSGERGILSYSGRGSGPAFASPIDVSVCGETALVVDAGLTALFEVDLETGARTILSDASHGSGIGFDTPTDVVVTSQGAIRVVDEGLAATIDVDPKTGDRSLVVSGGASGSGFFQPGPSGWEPGSGSFVPTALAIPEPTLLARGLAMLAVMGVLLLGRRARR